MPNDLRLAFLLHDIFGEYVLCDEWDYFALGTFADA